MPAAIRPGWAQRARAPSTCDVLPASSLEPAPYLGEPALPNAPESVLVFSSQFKASSRDKRQIA